MQYNLKEKIEITEEFLNELIAKSWQETETIQQQIANISTNTKLGEEVVKLLKNTCTSYYVLIGCLETLLENSKHGKVYEVEPNTLQDVTELKDVNEYTVQENNSSKTLNLQTEATADFEPFEYFVDFEEPSGEPLSDQDLYG